MSSSKINQVLTSSTQVYKEYKNTSISIQAKN